MSRVTIRRLGVWWLLATALFSVVACRNSDAPPPRSASPAGSGDAAVIGGVREARRVEFDPADAGRVLVVERGGDVALWRIENPSAPTLERRIPAAASDARFLAGGQGIVSGGADGVVQRWTFDGAKAWSSDKGSVVRALAVAPNTIAAAGEDGSVRVGNSAGESTATLATDAGPLLAVALSPAGDWLAAEGADTRLRLWRREPSGAFTGPTTFRKVNKRYAQLLPNLLRYDLAWGWDRSLAFAPDGQSLAAADLRGAVRRWNLKGETLGEPMRGPRKQHVRAIAFAPDGGLAEAMFDGTLLIRPPQSAAPLLIEGHAGAATSVAFSPDGRRLASAGIDGKVLLWSSSGERLGALPAAK